MVGETRSAMILIFMMAAGVLTALQVVELDWNSKLVWLVIAALVVTSWWLSHSLLKSGWLWYEQLAMVAAFCAFSGFSVTWAVFWLSEA